MRRQGQRAPQFAAHVEQLEERRVMSADPVGGALGGAVEPQAAGEEPVPQTAAVAALQASQNFGQAILTQDSLGAPISHQELGEPDFWADPANQISFGDYLAGISQSITDAHNQTGLFNVRNNYGFTGLGQTVAVIDSGIAWDHFALGGGLGKDYRVVGGWDFTEENDGNPYDDGTAGGHGSHVSGIIGGDSSTNSGVAPGVDFVGLRVFNDTGSGYFNWVENALRWVHEHRNDFDNPITTVNLSLGVSTWNAAAIPQWATLEEEFAQLASDGIFIAVAAGNYYANYNTPGLSYPAASPYVVPVMSTDDANTLSYFSQRLDRAIAAPGRSITSTVPDYKGNKNGVADDFATMSGTSMAAPYVAGASVLVRQAMQFVGRTNINQTMIYDHLMATADTLFDAVSNLSYKRLNLSRAIDALMPADDYGSSMAAAYNMGTISSSGMEMSGAIAKVGDVDYFTFTAGVTGTVSFDVTGMRESMTPAWQVYGATPMAAVAAAASGSELSFAVKAGQSYTVSLASLGGLGHYDFEMTTEAEEVFSFTDWGAVAYNQQNDVTVNGEAWYRVEAGRDGFLTVQGAFNAAAGDVHLELYDANLKLVAAGTTTGNVARVDTTAAAGTQFYVRVVGANSDVDFKLVNLVSQTGSVVTAFGTNGDDAIVFNAGASPLLTINGVSYGFAAGSASQFIVDAGAGQDSVDFFGSAAAERASQYTGSLAVTASSYSFTAAGVEFQRLHGDAGDVAYLYDSVGNDVYTASSDRVEMTGAGFSNSAYGFGQTYAYATAGGRDRADLYDTAGDDSYRAYADRVVMCGAGYSNFAARFEETFGRATQGRDTATMYDSTGDDVFTARPTYAVMRANDLSYSNRASGFDQVFATSLNGGQDRAELYDGATNDRVVAGPGYMLMRSTTGEFYNQAAGFASVRAYATAGGADYATLYDSSGDDVFTGRPDSSTMRNVAGTYCNFVSGFDQVYAYATAGGVDRAELYDSAGDDLYRSYADRAYLSGADYYLCADRST